MNPQPSVGIIGLGAMGLGVARTLLRKGFPLHACDVRPDVLAAVAAEGARTCAKPADLAPTVDALIVLVVNADQTDAVLFGPDGAAARRKPGSFVIASPTVPPH